MKFTTEDDENLMHYLAAVTPNREAGGRVGYRIYHQLVKLVCDLILQNCFATDRVTIGRGHTG
jgi:hypothetical protein